MLQPMSATPPPIPVTRIFLPGFAFPLSAACGMVPEEFARQCQSRARYHADEITKLLASVLPHGPEAFDDMICHMAAFQAAKVQIVHTAAFLPDTPAARQELAARLETNIRLMTMSGLDQSLLHVSSIPATL